MPEPNLPKTAEIQILTADELIPQLPIQVPGHAETFSEAELEAMVRSYNHDYLRAPLTKDHLQKGPALGWVRRLVKRGKALFAEVYGLAEELVKDVREGRYGSISIEAELNFKNSGKPYLTAVSFLGAGTPACAGMQRPVLSDKGELLAFCAASGENILCLPTRKLTLEEVTAIPEAAFDFDNFNLPEFAQDEQEVEYLNRLLGHYWDAVWKVRSSDRTDKADLIRKYTAQLDKAVAKKETTLSEPSKGGTAMAGENKELEVRLATLEADNKKLREEKEAELTKLRDENKTKDVRLADLERKNTLQSIDSELTTLVSAGKLTPAERKNGNLDALLACLPDTTVKLGDKELSPRQHLLAFLRERPVVVKLNGTVLGPEGDEPNKGINLDVLPKHMTRREEAAVDQKRAELASRAQEVMLREKKNNPAFTYRQAVIMAEKENPALVER